MDRLWGMDFVPCHGTLPKSRGKHYALDYTPDITVVEHRINDLDVIVGVRRGIVCYQRGWFYHPYGELGLHYCL